MNKEKNMENTGKYAWYNAKEDKIKLVSGFTHFGLIFKNWYNSNEVYLGTL